MPMSQRQPNVVALQVHLEDHQLVYFEPGQERQAAQAARRTHLTAWLEYNRESAAADPDCRRLLYPDFPSRHGTRAQVVDACLRRSALWRHFIVAPLLENMRARRAAGPDGPELRAFCDWLLELGEGRAEGPEDGFVQLPPHLVMDCRYRRCH
ncbi:hypothetical protein FJT64_009815 [Amphibalanus amphitrite]|uniref:ATP-dependent DNA helicase n=1 Tax=Amphibalanus amphitrite TaxID=1232801 RepID=A0A6A4VLB6_AMPAM|nr:hypothetical protein FJT64_009815 [Amphibalanus amphitrite]